MQICRGELLHCSACKSQQPLASFTKAQLKRCSSRRCNGCIREKRYSGNERAKPQQPRSGGRVHASGCGSASDEGGASNEGATRSAVQFGGGGTDELISDADDEPPFANGFLDCPRLVSGEVLSTVTEDGLTVYMTALTTEDGLTFRDPNGMTWIAGYYSV